MMCLIFNKAMAWLVALLVIAAHYCSDAIPSICINTESTWNWRFGIVS